jgi:hypothetical protein
MFSIGDTVFAFWQGSGHYHIGTIVESTSGMYRVVFADGDQGMIPENKIMNADLDEGLKVLAMWTDKRFYPGTIQKIAGLAAYIHFDDGDKGWTSLAGIARKI